MSVRDEIMRHEHEGYGVEREYRDGFNNGLSCAADVALEYISKLTDQRNHFERLVTYLRVWAKNVTVDDMLQHGDGGDIGKALSCSPVLDAEHNAAWESLTVDEKREMDALINWVPS